MFKIISATLFSAVAMAGTLQQGLKTSLDIAVLDQAKDAYFQTVIDIVNSVQIPDIYGDDGDYLIGNTFHVYDQPQYVEFTTDVNKNALVFKNRRLSAVFKSSEFRYKVAPLTVAKGHAEVDMNTVDIEVGLALGTRILPSGAQVLSVSSVDVVCNINRFDINIKLWGNFYTDLASLFEVFFVGTVAGLIEDTVRTALSVELPNLINYEIGKTNGIIPLGIPDFKLDWQTPINPTVTTTYSGITMNGIFFDALEGEIPNSSPVPASMPMKMTTHLEAFQNYVSANTMSSLLGTLPQVMTVGMWIYADEPHKYNFTMTTSSLNKLLPGIVNAYGADVPVDIYWQILNMENFQSQEAEQNLYVNGDVDVKFYINDTVTGQQMMVTDLKLLDIDANFTLLIQHLNMSA